MVIEEFRDILFFFEKISKSYILFMENSGDIANSQLTIQDDEIVQIIQHVIPDYEGINYHVVCSNNKLNSIGISLIDFFLRIHLFGKVLDFLGKIPISSFDIILTGCQCLYSLIYFIEPEVLKKERIMETMIRLLKEKYNTFLSLPDLSKELNKQIQDLIFGCSFQYLYFYQNIYEEGMELKELLTYDLKVAQYLFNLPVLGKKQYALNYLNTLSGSLCSFINFSRNPNNNFHPNLIKISNEKIKFFLEFLEKMNIFNAIFGENLHEALIVKSSEIVNFLYLNKKLSTENILYLWKLTQTSDSNISDKILAIFVGLIPMLSKEQSMDLLKNLTSQNFKDIKDITLVVLEKFISQTETDAEKENYCKILFTFASEKAFLNGLSPGLITKARKILVEVLLRDQFRNQLKKYIKKCIYGIGYNTMTNTYRFLLSNILLKIRENGTLDLYRFFHDDIYSFELFIEYLDKKYTLFSTLFYNILDVKQEILYFLKRIENYEDLLISSNNNIEMIFGENEENVDQRINANENEILQHNNLDNTLSTDKSLDNEEGLYLNDDNENNSLSSISTDISENEKEKATILQNFVKEYHAQLPFNKLNTSFVIQNLKFNFQNEKYCDIIQNLLDIIKDLILKSSIKITQKKIDFLSEVLLNNSIDKKERDIFYNFFYSIFEDQRLTKEVHITEKDITYLMPKCFFRYDVCSLPPSAFSFLREFFILVNSEHNNITFSQNGGRIISVNNFEQLAGFRTLWECYLNVDDKEISDNFFKIIINIFLVSINSAENINKIYDKIFSEFKNCESDLVVQKLIRILLSVNKACLNDPGEDEIVRKERLRLKIDNKYESNNSNVLNRVEIDSTETVAKLKDLIISEVILGNTGFNLITDDNFEEKKKMLHSQGMILMCKGKRLKDEFTLNDYKIENDSTILVFKDSPVEHPTFQLSQAQIDSGVSQLKVIFQNIREDVLRLAFKKNNGNMEETTMYLTEDSFVNMLEKELADTDENIVKDLDIDKNPRKKIVFTEEKIDTLLSLLNSSNKDLLDAIWNLMKNLTYPAQIVSNILSFKEAEIFNYKDKNRLLLYIKLINFYILEGEQFGRNTLAITEEKKVNFLLSTFRSEVFLNCFNFLATKLDDEVYESSFAILLDWIVEVLTKDKNIKILTGNYYIDEKIIEEKTILMKTKRVIVPLNEDETYEAVSCFSDYGFKEKLFDIVKFANVVEDKIFFLFFSLILLAFEIYPNYLDDVATREFKTSELFSILFTENVSEKKDPANSKSKQKIVLEFFKVLATCHGDFKIKIDDVSYTIEEVVKKLIKKNYKRIFTEKYVSIEFFGLFFPLVENDKPDEASHPSHKSNNYPDNQMEEESKETAAGVEINPSHKSSNYYPDNLVEEESKETAAEVEIDPSHKSINYYPDNLVDEESKETATGVEIQEPAFTIENKEYQDEKHVNKEYQDEKQVNKEYQDEQQVNKDEIDYEELIMHIIQKIYYYIEGVEETNLSGNDDIEMKDANNIHKSYSEAKQAQLIGYVDLFNLLIKKKKDILNACLVNIKKSTNKELIDMVYEALFTIYHNKSSESYYYKISLGELRKKFYVLLLTLVTMSEEFLDKLKNKFINHEYTKTIDEDMLSNIDIPYREKDDKYVGLRNYGATCYLNSLFQQLFMMPKFFNSIFQFNCEDELSSVIKNVQIAFASMKYTIMKYYPLKKFITSIKNAFNGDPINVKVQQDSDEFLAILCDNLENEAKTYKKENFLYDSFKGKISNEIVSLEKEYPYYSSRDEDFIRITLDIKNHKTLEEALDFFIKEEILQGENKYYVEKYDKKISISKRSSIKKMGENVIIHLKRFEFDYTSFTNYKLNDYIQFPHEINFSKWTRAFINKNSTEEIKLDEEEKENLIPEKLNYVLTGILIHSGSSIQHGHYYSFIMDQSTGKWRRYDDIKVSDFNKDDIEAECFGENKDNYYIGPNGFNMYRKCQTAYLLFYTRKDCLNFKCENWISQSISDYVDRDNKDFVKMKMCVNSDYSEFIEILTRNFEQDDNIIQNMKEEAEFVKNCLNKNSNNAPAPYGPMNNPEKIAVPPVQTHIYY